jgi:outer membrane protein TolC
MKNNSILTALAALFAISTVSAGAAEEYTLQTYVAVVEKNNRDMQLAQLNTKVARETVHEALAALLPAAGISAGYTRNLTDVQQPAAAYAHDAGLAGVYPIQYENADSNYDNEMQIALGVSQNIYNPDAVAKYELAEKNLAIQCTSEQFTRQLLLTTAKKMYSQVELLTAVAAVRNETVTTSEAVFKNIEKKFTAGTATELDLRMAEVDWKNDISVQAEAEKNAALGIMALKTLAGLPQETDMTLRNTGNTYPEHPETADTAEVMHRRADYQTALMEKDMADIRYRSAVNSFLPSVTGTFSIAYGQYGGYENKDDWDAYHYTAAQLGIKISLPLYTGGYRLALVHEAEAGKAAAQLQIVKKQDEIAQELESVKLRLDESFKKIESAMALETASQRAAELASVAFNNGLSTQIAVSQANTHRAQAKLNLQNAIFEYRMAYYDWEFAHSPQE